MFFLHSLDSSDLNTGLLMAQAMKNFQKQQAIKQAELAAQEAPTKAESLALMLKNNVQSSSVGTDARNKPTVVMPSIVPALNAKRIEKPTLCWNCEQPVSKGISKSEKNPDRVYIRCTLGNVYPMCGEFFLWDDATQDELRQSVRIWREKINKQAYLEEAQKKLGPPPANFGRKRKNGEASFEDTNRFPITVGPNELYVDTVKEILAKQEEILAKLVKVAKHIKVNPRDHQGPHDASSPPQQSSLSNSTQLSPGPLPLDVNEISQEPDYGDE